jgi:hypothetical protein
MRDKLPPGRAISPAFCFSGMWNAAASKGCRFPTLSVSPNTRSATSTPQQSAKSGNRSLRVYGRGYFPVLSLGSLRGAASRGMSGRSAAWLARLVRDQEVEGSNPFAPTTSFKFNNMQAAKQQTTSW